MLMHFIKKYKSLTKWVSKQDLNKNNNRHEEVGKTQKASIRYKES